MPSVGGVAELLLVLGARGASEELAEWAMDASGAIERSGASCGDP